MNEAICQKSIRVRGIVQGVGFRPLVWRRARALGLNGQVCNDGDGVLIKCRGSEKSIETLIEQLRLDPPTQAHITAIESVPNNENIPQNEFLIADSMCQTSVSTAISPDLATCSECLADIEAVDGRRHRYPFTNCTHCGPRFSIIRALPYDRVNTSMASFALCPACLREYRDPADRRFHAQPNACSKCGPTLQLIDNRAQAIAGDPVAVAQRFLKQGLTVAIKGIGGFQLAVDATNAKAVARLRERKRRPHKPFASMARDLSVVRRYCEVSDGELTLLQSPAAPIVLLARKPGASLEGVAPDQHQLGFMLPTTVLHHLLLADFDTPLVMTSGNPSGAPQCIDNDTAIRELAGVADLFLLHDRDVVQRIDDSVVKIVEGQCQFLRRARGYAPGPLPVPPGFESSPDVLAMGSDLKNTFCLLRQEQAVLSPHIGDLQDAVTLGEFEHCLHLFRKAHSFLPQVIAVDQHPQSLAGDCGRRVAATDQCRLIEVQHHHAHIAACLGDNLRPLDAAPVLAVALDGLGYAKTDNGGELWGGEIFLADYQEARRLAGLKPVALPGGNAAMREPWRNLVAQLEAAIGWSPAAKKYADLPPFRQRSEHAISPLLTMIARNVNAPLSSSCGRLFDAVAAAVGFVTDGRMSYEGQAAMMLEAVIDEAAWHESVGYAFAHRHVDDFYQIDPAPLWRALLEDLHAGFSSGVIAARFHHGLADALCQCVIYMGQVHATKTVALSGGVLQNVHLLSAMNNQLRDAGFNVLMHRQTPANDGGIAFGQALIAAAHRPALKQEK